jgi:putative DNA primase/helicase
MLPEKLVPWLEDIADRMQVPLDFVGVPAMAVFGSVIGCKVGIRPKQEDDWTEVANVWAIIIARPGFMKSPAVTEILRPMYRSAEDAAETYSDLQKEYEFEAEIYKAKRSASVKKGQRLADPEPAEPAQRRYFTNDSTYEKLCEILRDNPSGTLLHRDEVVSLLRYLDREENSQSRGFYLTAWSGTQRYDSDRIGRGAIHVKHACISVLGTTQPGTISEYVRRATTGGRGDDGMIQRFGLAAWPDTSPEWKNVDRYPLKEPRDAVWEAFRRLDAATPDGLGAAKGEFDRIHWLRFTPEAQAEFELWREKLEARVRSGELHPAIESHIAKYRGLIPRLALITHLIDVGKGPVGHAAVLRALMWVEYLEAHALRLYGAGAEPGRAAARAILSKLRAGALKDRFTARDVHRPRWAGLDDHEHVQLGLDLLRDHDWIVPIELETGGRPRVEYAINPRGLP